MGFEEDSLDNLKAIIRTAFKYNLSSGLHPSIPDLERIRKSFLSKGLISDAEEIDFLINFLKKEKDQYEERKQELIAKTRELSKEIPIGLVVSFRHCEETLSGELRGFLGDRVLVMAKFKDKNRLFEVSPFDLKL